MPDLDLATRIRPPRPFGPRRIVESLCTHAHSHTRTHTHTATATRHCKLSNSRPTVHGELKRRLTCEASMSREVSRAWPAA